MSTTVVIKFSEMANYVCNYDITHAKSKLYKTRQTENMKHLLDAGVSEKAAHDICFLANIRHIYHCEMELLFENKEHIKLLKQFLKNFNRTISTITPAISPLIIDKDGYNNLTSDQNEVFYECIEKFNDCIRAWLSNEIDKKLHTQFVSIDVDAPKNESRQRFFEKTNKDKLINTKRMARNEETHKLSDRFFDQRIFLDKDSVIYQTTTIMLVPDAVNKFIINYYERNMPQVEIPEDLSFFNSDNMWEMTLGNKNKDNADAKNRFLTARYYIAKEISDTINVVLKEVARRTAAKYMYMTNRTDYTEVFPHIAYTMFKTNCHKDDSVTIDDINKCITTNLFTIYSIPGMNHGILFRGIDTLFAPYYYAANLAAATKMSSKVVIPYFLNVKWNGVKVPFMQVDSEGYILRYGERLDKMFNKNTDESERIYRHTDEARKEYEKDMMKLVKDGLPDFDKLLEEEEKKHKEEKDGVK